MKWVLIFFGVCAFCTSIVAATCFFARQRLRSLSLKDLLLLLYPFFFAPFILVWGLIFSWWGPEDTEPIWRLEATRWLCYLVYPSLCAFSIWKSRGLRPVAVGLIPLSLVVGLFAAGLAFAFVTGD
jgi:hypothetical protein